MLSALLFLTAILVAGSAPAEVAQAAAGTTYYVDPGGSDSNSGTSPEAAWQSLAKVNATTFQPGDSVLLKAGSSWTGQLSPRGSGAAGAPITLASYGAGARPAIHGGGVGDAVYLENQQYWEIRDLEVSNDAAAPARRAGIRIRNATGGVLRHIQIRNVHVHDVYSNVDGYYGRNAGIAVVADLTASWWDGVVIADNTVDTVERIGIFVGPTEQSGNPGDYWRYPASTGVDIGGNRITNVGGDAILAYVTERPRIHHNTVHVFSRQNGIPQQGPRCPEDSYPDGERYCNGPSAAIWMAESDGATVEYNEVSGGIGTWDGQAFDIDWGSDDVTIQYNYSRDNAGGFLLLVDGSIVHPTYPDNNNAVVRYNVSQNDSRCFLCFGADGFDAPKPLQVYNNVDYVGSAANRPRWLLSYDGRKPSIVAPFTVANNIIVKLGAAMSYLPGGTYRNNVHYGNHLNGGPAGAGQSPAKPLFAAPGTGGAGLSSLAGYHLQTGSPALGSGALIGANGGRDFFGNPVSATTAPHRGAYAGPAVSGSAAGNLAISADVTASSSVEAWGWALPAVNDGTRDAVAGSSGWSSGNDLAVNHPEWVQLTFPGRRWFDTVELRPRNDGDNAGAGFPVDFTVEVWNGSAWIPVVSRLGQADPGGQVQSFTFPAQWTDRIRVHGTRLRPNPVENNAYRMQFAEIEVRNVSGPRLIASSSYESGSWSVHAATDGLTGSTGASAGWSSDANLTSNHAESLEYRLGAARSVGWVDLYPRNDGANTGYGFPVDFTVEVWDGSAWIAVATRTGYARPAGQVQRFTFAPRQTDRIRIRGTSLRANPGDQGSFRMQFAEVVAG